MKFFTLLLLFSFLPITLMAMERSSQNDFFPMSIEPTLLMMHDYQTELNERDILQLCLRLVGSNQAIINQVIIEDEDAEQEKDALRLCMSLAQSNQNDIVDHNEEIYALLDSVDEDIDELRRSNNQALILPSCVASDQSMVTSECNAQAMEFNEDNTNDVLVINDRIEEKELIEGCHKGNKIQCKKEQCGAYIYRSSNLKKHEQRVHELNKYKCLKCQEPFSSRIACNQHQNVCIPDHQIQCKKEQCGAYIDSYRFKKHEQTVHELNKYKCLKCQKPFSSVIAYKQHKCS